MGVRSGAAGVFVVLLVAAVAVGPAVGAAGTDCAADGAKKLCFADVSLSTDRLVSGESATLNVTVENRGDVAANATVVLKTASPNNETETFNLREERLEPGESLTVTQRLDASTPGTHGLQAVLYGDGYAHAYDTSAVLTMVVEERGGRLGGPVDTPELALAALVGALAVLGAVVLRQQ
ncbi:CARDB domain-containing protein [Halobaculum sp. D14]|uniref:CARDB domain-containing protein n=1 Tax=Halobaculum sp. D14 TaxID=3421642 RepID=UPI003EC02220